MGKEKTCSAVIDGVRTEGRALLETDEILFRGPVRWKLALRDIRKVTVRGDDLVLKYKGGQASFALRPKQAQAWADRILKPPDLLDKLGVRHDTTAVVLAIDDAAFLKVLGERAGASRGTRARRAQRASGTTRKARRGSGADMVVLGVETLADLARLEGLDRLIRADGGIWVVYPKGRRDIREADVLAAGRAMGWKDNKTCRFSETHTGLRFVIPLAARPGSTKRNLGRT